MNRGILSDLLSRSLLLIPVAIGFGYAFILNKLPVDKHANDNKEVVRGILLILMGHFVTFIFFFFSSKGNEFLPNITQVIKGYAAFIFLAQLVYSIPLVVVAAGKRRSGVLKGSLIASSLTFLLSVISCFGLGALR
jgi:hypothetical protein